MVRIEWYLPAGTVATPVAPAETPVGAQRKYFRQTPSEIALHSVLCSASRQRPPAMNLPSPAGTGAAGEPALQACLLDHPGRALRLGSLCRLFYRKRKPVFSRGSTATAPCETRRCQGLLHLKLLGLDRARVRKHRQDR